MEWAIYAIIFYNCKCMYVQCSWYISDFIIIKLFIVCLENRKNVTFFLFFNQKYNTQNSAFFLLFMYIKQKSDYLFDRYSCTFVRFMCYLDPFYVLMKWIRILPYETDTSGSLLENNLYRLVKACGGG